MDWPRTKDVFQFHVELGRLYRRNGMLLYVILK